MVPLLSRFNVSQSDRSAPSNWIRFQPPACFKGGVVLFHFHRRELPGYVQYQVRNEPALRKYVGLAAAYPRLQSNTGPDWVRRPTMAEHRAVCRGRTNLRLRDAQLCRYGGGISTLRT